MSKFPWRVKRANNFRFWGGFQKIKSAISHFSYHQLAEDTEFSRVRLCPYGVVHFFLRAQAISCKNIDRRYQAIAKGCGEMFRSVVACLYPPKSRSGENRLRLGTMEFCYRFVYFFLESDSILYKSANGECHEKGIGLGKMFGIAVRLSSY